MVTRNTTPKIRRYSAAARIAAPKKKPQPSRSVKALLESFEVQPAQLSKDVLDNIEASFQEPDGDARTRLIALFSLLRSGGELIKAVSGGREGAIALAQAIDPIDDYANRLRSLADLLETASTRIGIALCWRDDFKEVMREAREVQSAGGVANAAHAPSLRLVVDNTVRP